MGLLSLYLRPKAFPLVPLLVLGKSMRRAMRPPQNHRRSPLQRSILRLRRDPPPPYEGVAYSSSRPSSAEGASGGSGEVSFGSSRDDASASSSAGPISLICLLSGRRRAQASPLHSSRPKHAMSVNPRSGATERRARGLGRLYAVGLHRPSQPRHRCVISPPPPPLPPPFAFGPSNVVRLPKHDAKP